MLAAAAARLEEHSDMIWVDLGGGTGVRYLSQYSLIVIHCSSLIFI